MIKVLFYILFLIPYGVFAQTDFDTQISNAALAVSKKIEDINGNGKKIVVIEFKEVDGSLTYLGKFLSDELISALINQSDNQRKFVVVNHDFIEKDINRWLNKTAPLSGIAKTVGNLNVADIVIFGEISDFETSYRTNLRLFSAKTGDEITSTILIVQKTKALNNYYETKVSQISENNPDKPVQSPQSVTTNVSPPIRNCPTGDFCFENTSDKRKVIDILGAQTNYTREVIFTITILPGEKGCFYAIPAQVQNIAITTFDVEEKKGINMFYQTQPAVIHTDYAQIKVKSCATESDIQPMKLH